MPLPTRAPSIRSSTTDSRTHPTATSRLTKAKPPESERQKKDAVPSETSIKGSTGDGQGPSRIPSPLKRNPPSQSNHTYQVRSSQNKPPNKGHVRQRSAVQPLPSTRQRFGHARSVSAVSVNTTTSTSSNDTSKPAMKSNLDGLQRRPTSVKPKILPTQKAGPPPVAATRSETIPTQLEAVQNELLQLSAVHRQSSRTISAYQRSTEQFLALREADLSSKRAEVQARKRTFCAALNLLGLDAWLTAEGSQKTCQSLQNLSIAVRDLQNLESIFEGSDGLAAAFITWQQKIRDRETGDVAQATDFIMIHTFFESRLAPEIRRFQQQVSSVSASLSTLPESPPDTSLASVIRGHALLATSLASQCQIMLQLGDCLVADHRRWLQAEVRAAIAHKPDRSVKVSESRPVWDG